MIAGVEIPWGYGGRAPIVGKNIVSEANTIWGMPGGGCEPAGA